MLRVRRVTKSFGGLKAVDDVDLEVERGSLTLLIGPNGSGKTTLINTISGVYKPDSGDVIFDGQDITGWESHRIFSAGLVRTFQTPALFPKMTVLENVLVAARDNEGEKPLNAILTKGWMKEEERTVKRALEILSIVELGDKWNSYAYQLSGGQMKLLEIAKVLMTEPKMIMMDEPIAGVLPKLAHEILELLVDLKMNGGLTFLMVEHRLDIMLGYADHVYVMHNGKMIYSGKPTEALKDPLVIEAYLGG